MLFDYGTFTLCGVPFQALHLNITLVTLTVVTDPQH